MLYDCRGRCAHTIEEAEHFIREFIAENRVHSHDRVGNRSFDYDLYLPWLIEVVENMPTRGIEPSPSGLLERLYTEAAWQLCQEGYLRMGPRRCTQANVQECYGKGFSLTFKGEDWVGEIIRSTSLNEPLVA